MPFSNDDPVDWADVFMLTVENSWRRFSNTFPQLTKVSLPKGRIPIVLDVSVLENMKHKDNERMIELCENNLRALHDNLRKHLLDEISNNPGQPIREYRYAFSEP